MYRRTRNTLETLTIAALIVAALSLPAVLVGPDPAGANDRANRLCFSAVLWSANDAERPCYSISGPEEDGSGRLTIKAERKTWRCSIPNPHEAGKAFRIVCRRAAS